MKMKKQKTNNNATCQESAHDMKIDLTTAEQVAAFALQKVLREYKNFQPEQKMDLIWSGANHLALRTKSHEEAMEDPTEIRVQVIQDKDLPRKQLGFSLLKSMFTVYTRENPKSKIQIGTPSATIEDYLLSIISDNLPSAGAKMYYTIGEICAGSSKLDYVEEIFAKKHEALQSQFIK